MYYHVTALSNRLAARTSENVLCVERGVTSAVLNVLHLVYYLLCERGERSEKLTLNFGTVQSILLGFYDTFCRRLQ